MDVSHALMEVMCEQLQSVLHTFHQQQAAEKATAQETELDSSGTKQVGEADLKSIQYMISSLNQTDTMYTNVFKLDIHVYLCV